MIRYAVVTTIETTVPTLIGNEHVDVIHPPGRILRSGVCADQTFNRQGLSGDETVVEIAAEDWPINDRTHYIDLSGEEPVVTKKPHDTVRVLG